MIIFYETLNFLQELRRRNNVFFYFGMGFSALFLVFLSTFIICQNPLSKMCFWLKPFKFSISFAIYVLSLGWYMEYLKKNLGERKIKCISWVISIAILIEMGVVLAQSFLTSDNSYFLKIFGNTTESLSRNLYLFGNFLVIANTIIVAYISLQFFRKISIKPVAYLWGIRAGFVIFILSGFLGAFLIAHYGQVAPNPSQYGIPFTHFSSHRDNLITLHFLGIHSLQLIPLGCYFLTNRIGKMVSVSSVGLYMMAYIFLTSQAILA